MPDDPSRHFPADYAAGRAAFLAAAEARGARHHAHSLGARGPEGGELALDVAYLGPEAPARLLAVSSGIHGVEGYAGSAAQHRLLVEQLDGLELPADTGLLLVHAINPFGFAHGRRVNESNVDLNRNFLRHPEEHVANPDYDALDGAINPERLDEESEAESQKALLEWGQEHGMAELQRVLTCGQYRHPHGVQFGGVQEEESNLAFREILRVETRGASKIAWIDLHTGLGPYGECEMITEMLPGDPAYLRGEAWFGQVQSSNAGESYSAALHGVVEQAMEQELPADCELTAVTPEFGTYEPIRVFRAMRADNWLRRHGDPDSEQGRRIRAELLEVFRPRDPSWQRRVLATAARILQQARDGLARS